MEKVHEVVTRNVRVLMAVRGVQEQKELARMLGWDKTKVSRTLKGQRDWSLDDVVVVSKTFGVSPGDLLGDISTLVGAPATAAVSAANSAEVMSPYLVPEPLTLISAKRTKRRQDVARADSSSWVVSTHAA